MALEWWKMMENDGKWWKMMENDGKWWKYICENQLEITGGHCHLVVLSCVVSCQFMSSNSLPQPLFILMPHAKWSACDLTRWVCCWAVLSLHPTGSHRLGSSSLPVQSDGSCSGLRADLVIPLPAKSVKIYMICGEDKVLHVSWMLNIW